MKDGFITNEKLFSDVTIFNNLYSDAEKWKHFFLKVKPLLQMENLVLATKLGDIYLAFVLFLGRRKEQYNKHIEISFINELFDASKENNLSKQTTCLIKDYNNQIQNMIPKKNN